MPAIVFLDTETTGLSLDDDIWEFAGIRQAEDGTESTLHLFIEHDEDKCMELPESFATDHLARYDPDKAVSRAQAAMRIGAFTSGRAHIVGAVPNFDTERIARLLAEYDLSPDWHYHLICAEVLAMGYLAGRASHGDLSAALDMPDLPWDSNILSRAVGVEPPTKTRHTAMGDARWAKAIHDAVMGITD